LLLGLENQPTIAYCRRSTGYVVLGGALLAITSIISLYWGLVGLDSTLHGFDWILLTTICFLSFGFGLTVGILSMRRKNQTLVIFAVTALIFTNLVGVKSSLDMYQLANPWLILIVSLVLSVISGFLVSNADEAFTQNN
jgi:peptidoglycan/LPS O-acetylase OafA/YrhL